ncbi:NAC transcription factor [Nymphaea thermarum]|nr:NAC transcription factor [Nymphaea thermarum]
MEGVAEQIYLPPGFRFHPSDEELILQYLLPKTLGMAFSHNVIADINLYRYDPWVLPEKALLIDFKNEWYFFTQRDRKYPNGSRPNRGAGSGFWKATGTDKMITSSGRKVGVKKSLVFYIGKPPNVSKTNWIMHEYGVLLDGKNDSFPQNKELTRVSGDAAHFFSWPEGERGQMDNWFLCRIYRKNQNSLQRPTRRHSEEDAEAVPSFKGDRKYPNCSRPNRGSGFWKATGTDKTITSGGRKVGVKKSLVFYIEKPPNESKTNWIMYEYKVLLDTASPKIRNQPEMEGTGDEMYLPPGFRFHPSDEELLVQYLLPKTSGLTFSSNVIADVQLYRHDPWDLPGKAFFSDNEWYFFSRRDRKFPNGSRSNRGAGSGFWKATGTDKTIVADGRKVGIKKALVFYVGKPPSGSKTNWIMHEYQLLLDDNGCLPQKKATPRLDDWVLCRIYKKPTSLQKGMQRSKQHDEVASSPSDEETFASLPAGGDQRSESNVNQWTAVREMNAGYQQQQLTYSSDFTLSTGGEIYLPPGFRFHPTDEELLIQYLLPKTSAATFSSNVIADVDLYRHDPWDLTGKSLLGDKEWYFFSRRDRKFPNGSRPKRGAGSGFWKATGTDKTIVVDGRKMGTKKALVFYVGKPPNGSKTNWIMHEYQLLVDDNGCLPQKKATPPVSDHPSALLSFVIQLDDWVLCRIYKKRTSQQKGIQRSKQHDEGASSHSDEETFASVSAGGDQRSESNLNQWTVGTEMNAGYQQQQQTYSSDFTLNTDEFFIELPTHTADNCISLTEKIGGSFSTQLIDAFYFQNHHQQPYSCLFN